mmetsp:Transcript_17596/g.38103  ORF Transcript_17596/g.38103 Transcript_17596/m.38103 type:complete len:293 (-) Transcript_17596:1780-2658(-)
MKQIHQSPRRSYAVHIHLAPAIHDRILRVIHVQNLIARRRFLRLLVRPDPLEPREPQPDAPPGFARLVDRSLVSRRLGEVGGLDLPDLHGVEPDVGLQRVRNVVLGALLGNDVVLERVRQFLEVFVGEARADFADALELLRVLVVAREEVGTVGASSLSLAVVSSQGYQIHGIAEPVEVVLFELEPIERSAVGLVRGVVIQRLDHQALALSLNSGVQELLDDGRVAVFGVIQRRCILELALDGQEVLLHQIPPLRQRLIQQRLAVQVHQIEGLHDHPDLGALGRLLRPLSGR